MSFTEIKSPRLNSWEQAFFEMSMKKVCPDFVLCCTINIEPKYLKQLEYILCLLQKKHFYLCVKVKRSNEGICRFIYQPGSPITIKKKAKISLPVIEEYVLREFDDDEINPLEAPLIKVLVFEHGEKEFTIATYFSHIISDAGSALYFYKDLLLSMSKIIQGDSITISSCPFIQPPAPKDLNINNYISSAAAVQKDNAKYGKKCIGFQRLKLDRKNTSELVAKCKRLGFTVNPVAFAIILSSFHETIKKFTLTSETEHRIFLRAAINIRRACNIPDYQMGNFVNMKEIPYILSDESSLQELIGKITNNIHNNVTKYSLQKEPLVSCQGLGIIDKLLLGQEKVIVNDFFMTPDTRPGYSFPWRIYLDIFTFRGELNLNLGYVKEFFDDKTAAFFLQLVKKNFEDFVTS